MALERAVDVLKDRTLQDVVSGLGVRDGIARSVLGKIVADEVVCRLDHDKSKVTISIKERLTTEQENCLISGFPEYNLKFATAVVNDHGVAAVHRRLSNRILLDRVAYFDRRESTRQRYTSRYGRDVYVKDFGGNFSYYLYSSHDSVHCCCPSLDSKDASRHVDRLQAARRIDNPDAIQKKMITDLRSVSTDGDRFTNSICRHRSHKCSIKADYVIMQDSSYDHPLNNLADALVQADAIVCYGSFIFTPDILVRSKGFLPALNVEWEHLDSNRKSIYVPSDISVEHNYDGVERISANSVYIRFTFRDCAALNYTHRTDVYLQYVTISKFFNRDGSRAFLLERMENRNGYQFFKISRIDVVVGTLCQSLKDEHFDHDLWLKNDRERYVVDYYDLSNVNVQTGVENVYPVGDSASLLVSRRFTAPTYLVEKGLAYAKGVTETKYKPEEIYNFLRGLNYRIPTGTSVKKPTDDLNSYELKLLASAIYLKVYDEKYRGGKVIQQLLSDVNHNRNVGVNVAVFKKFLNVVTFGSVYSQRPTNKIARTSGGFFSRKFYKNNVANIETALLITQSLSTVHVQDSKSQYVSRWYRLFNGELASVTAPLKHVSTADAFDRMIFRVYGGTPTSPPGPASALTLTADKEPKNNKKKKRLRLVKKFNRVIQRIKNPSSTTSDSGCGDELDIDTAETDYFADQVAEATMLMDIEDVYNSVSHFRQALNLYDEGKNYYVDFPRKTAFVKDSIIISNDPQIKNRLNTDFDYDLASTESSDMLFNMLSDSGIQHVYYYFNLSAFGCDSVTTTDAVGKLLRFIGMAGFTTFDLVVPYDITHGNVHALRRLLEHSIVLSKRRCTRLDDYGADYYLSLKSTTNLETGNASEFCEHFVSNRVPMLKIIHNKLPKADMPTLPEPEGDDAVLASSTIAKPTEPVEASVEPFKTNTTNIISTPTNTTIYQPPVPSAPDLTSDDDQSVDVVRTQLGGNTLSHVRTPTDTNIGTEMSTIGDGHCLYRALTEHREVSIDAIRAAIASVAPDDIDLRTETAPNEWGGTRVIEAFCLLYSVSVSITDKRSDNTVMVKKDDNFIRTIYVAYHPGHYNYIAPRCLAIADEVVTMPAKQMFRPLDLSALVAWLNRVRGVPLSYPDLITWHAKPTEGFVNNLHVFCNRHIRCINNNFLIMIDIVVENRLCGVVGVFETDNFGLDQVRVPMRAKLTYIVLPTEFTGYFCVRMDYVDEEIVNTVDCRHLAHCCPDTRLTVTRYKAPNVESYCDCARVSDSVLKSVRFTVTDDNRSYIEHVKDTIVVRCEPGKSRRFLRDVAGVCDMLTCALDRYVYDEVVLMFNGFVNTAEIIRMINNRGDDYSIDPTVTESLPIGPDYILGVDDVSSIVNSMREVRWMWQRGIDSLCSNILPDHTKAVHFAECHGTEPLVVTTGYGLVDTVERRWIITPSASASYHCAFDGRQIIGIEGLIESGKIHRNKQFQGPRYLSVNRETVLVNYDKFVSSTAKYNVSTADVKFKLKIIEGAPGVGKTQYILENHNPTTDLVLTSTKDAAVDLRVRAARANGKLDDRALKERYRTVDSLIMHGFRSRHRFVRTLWIDEGFMRHCGDWFWCAVIAEAKEVVVIGDSAQIPFIERQGLPHHYSCYTDVCPKSVIYENLSISRRVPCDVAHWLNVSRSYSFSVTTANARQHSVETQLISNETAIPIALKAATTLVFTQSEKDTLTKLGFKTSTIHEFQGKQAAVVVLVRLNPKDIPVYDSQPHVLVALTRHTEKFIYFTVKQDSVSALVDDIAQYGASDLTRVVHDNMKGGGIRFEQQCERELYSDITFDDGKAVVMYQQEKSLRDFVQLNGETGYVPGRPRHHPFPVVEPVNRCTKTEVLLYDVSDPCGVLQAFVDESLPGSSTEFDTYDQYLLHHTFDDYNHPEVNLRVDWTNYSFEHEVMTPFLRTHAPRPTANTQEALLKAYIERNGDPPNLTFIVSCDKESDDMIKEFVASYVERKDLLSNYADNPLSINVDSMRSWLRGQPPSVEKIISRSELSVYLRDDLNVYEYVLKRVRKIDLEINAQLKFKSPQTIAYQSKEINAIFCPIVKEIKLRLLAILNDRVVVNTDMSPDDLERVVTYTMNKNFSGRPKYHLEADQSKFDKSQNMLTLIYELKMLRMFGFPDQLLDIWLYQHRRSVLLNRARRFRAVTEFQRKSGDAMTYLGNTLFLMAVMARLYTLSARREDVFLFSGDDSLFFSEYAYSREHNEITQIAADVYNLETKILHYDTPYFCSKYFVYYDNFWYIVPDLLKLVVKLGRKDLVSEEHVELYRISYLDNIKNYRCSELYETISIAHFDRYRRGFVDVSYVICALLRLVSSSSSFASIYSRNPLAPTKFYSTLPNLDI